MAKQTVNIGVTANDNTGDPLRTAFDKLNDNFDEVYAAGPVGTNIQISDNTIASTNTNGNIDLDPAGTGKVLVNGPMDANGVVTLNSTVTGNITPTANVTYNIGGTSTRYNEIHGNVLHVGPLVLKEVGTMLEIFQSDGVTNAILSGNSTTAGSVLNNGNTVVSLTQNGPITFYANNYQDGNATVTVINSGNITTPAAVVTGNVTGGNIVTTGLVSATGNVSGSNVNATSQVIATGNITGGNLVTAGQVIATGNITGGNVSGTALTGTLETASQPNITSVGTLTSLTASGNIDGGNLTTAGAVTATDNVTGGNLVTAGETNTATVTYSGDSTSQTTAYVPSFLAIDSDGSAIQTTFTNVLGNSITLNAGKRYEVMAHVILDNDATGNITFGFQESAGDATQIVARMDALTYSGGFADAKQFNTGTTVQVTDMGSTGTYHIQFTGTIKTVSATNFGLFANVATGNITPKAGSSIRIVEYGSDTIGTIA